VAVVRLAGQDIAGHIILVQPLHDDHDRRPLVVPMIASRGAWPDPDHSQRQRGIALAGRSGAESGRGAAGAPRIVKDGNRSAEVIDRIRALIKRAPPRRDRLEINGAIREVIELTRGEALRNGVSVQVELANGLPLVQGDRVELQQVLLNLVANAVEAMTGTSEETRRLLINSGKADTGGVCVSVVDSGPGLAPGAIDRLFEAFYTTKPAGLGLGLCICRSIIEAHGGQFWASANVARGATFQFTVPAHPDTAL
jgi:C4-dicarboxylate-specific signal transduction histidine kinase